MEIDAPFPWCSPVRESRGALLRIGILMSLLAAEPRSAQDLFPYFLTYFQYLCGTNLLTLLLLLLFIEVGSARLETVIYTQSCAR